MNIVVDKKCGIPLYIQVKKQIMDLIKEGTLKVGNKMPTERELSQELNVSRNTISTAYNQLESSGVLKSIQGKGTFVAEEAILWKNQEVKDKIVKFVDLALEEALETGVEAEDFLEIVVQRVKEKKELMERITAVFVECNIEQARMFSKQLTKNSNMNVIPLTVGDLEEMSEQTESIVEQCQVMIATFNHVNEVKNSIRNMDKEVLGVAINPNLESIVKIARHPADSKFGFICLSEEFIFKMKSALEGAGLGDLKVDYSNDLEDDKVSQIIEESDVLIVTPGRYKDVSKLNLQNKEIIEFSYSLDNGSVKALKSKIIEIKYKQNHD
ncbi:MAG: winged helix-turn-helix transcriptional regulator [Clostridium argentinense]|uniref:Winged helix-turn-helix transcriptional regulator n=1 Tax=Clostridium faecium TaxID=2762223 RepID=A0ABR8YN90_9CLOT|nr:MULTISPECIES: winged helix-turn-helix domain-containing protein [Clostridium]MBD8045597.1 winged helix-turn-helix transcriptional regulator [Clostridium faecium]MBS5823490.1 winged helix-turn-helix transcriptional regulator [Clostridium argentinense]MDU1349908.1 winged helix-turn-helix domain-containing protein [Clostridium argentinense]